MATPEISRRTFLAASGGLVIAASVSWSDVAFAHNDAPSGSNGDVSALVLSSDLYASPDPQRFVFAVAKGRQRSSFGPARVGFAPPGETKGTLLDTKLYKAGLPKGRGVYVTHAVFDRPGTWTAVTLTHGTQVPFAIEVKPTPDAPVVGSAAPRAPSPTTKDPLGVNPICTRQPKCPLHSVSLADVIGAGTPVAVMFATPARCQSRYCGPVLDDLLSVRRHYGNRIRFVHVEIYQNNKTTDLISTLLAWHAPGANPPELPSEPWLFTLNGAGTIVGRIDGAFGTDEIRSQLDALVAKA
jgi:hypothetical protein